MKKIITVLFFLPFVVKSQNNILILKGTAPSFYLTHVVAAKQSLYSLARMYNVAPKDLAAQNKIAIDKGLTIGQSLKIPVTASNFLQSGTPTADENAIPLYHTVADKEGLYRVSLNHNKVLMADLRKWNNLASDVLATGTNIIVGFLRVKKAESSLVAVSVNPPDGVPPHQKKDIKPDNNDPVIFDPPQPPVKKNEEQPPVKTPKTDPPKPVVKNEPIQPVITNGTGDNFDGGVFKKDFNPNPNIDLTTQTGTAGVFKSTSGWEDGKYYCLHNAATSGTIIKVTNKVTGKSIYAKVLDAIPDIKQNAGLIIRISNAAADILGVVGEAKFECTLSY